MKPLNLDNKPCSPISSNCVVWQGPDIPCIKLCTGDTVSDVVSAMATELCTILDTLKVSNYDLTCFNLAACPPEDFQALIQFLIKKICELEGIPVEEIKEDECPDCVVSVAECFVIETQTTMQLVEYVQLIGERICSIANDISLIQDQITDIIIRVTDLENKPDPTFTLPSFTLSCTVGALTGDQTIDTVLIEFINNVWCSFFAETGTTAALNAAGNQKCVGDADTQLNTGTAFSTNPNWIADADYDTLADAVNNIWVVLCDVWNYTSGDALTIQDEGVSLPQRNIINFIGDGVTATDDGVSKTVVDVPGGNDTFIARIRINNQYDPLIFPGGTASQIPSLAASPPDGFPDSPIAWRFNQVSFNDTIVNSSATSGAFVANVDLPAISFGTFDNENATGAEFTINETAVYQIGATCHLKADNPGTGLWQTTGTGTFGLGIVRTGFNLEGGNSIPVVQNLTKHVNLSFHRTQILAAGNVLRLAIQNLTDRTYDGVTYSGIDFINFSITKIK